MSEMLELCCGAVDRWILVSVAIIGSTGKLSATNSRQQLPFYELPHGRQTLPKSRNRFLHRMFRSVFYRYG